ncbi:YolD-like protein [Cytobacillus horneckiae]|uniref:YolD-like family protein n=1 Tax=Cytobacillus horneckiae TaxID=549687 RepID=A0A2N0ZCJ5_9BACI|nr:YolD-like family protein [Cytobacillus horneckiae]NRG44460.1 YolD-like family protein [Bacillus sp. CRN 9]MBN6888330.1 YolD-like family protein [Cytobacillus horneckiae]MCM3180054.1 YolD-like family protein [Cytobacillus horneckiae]MEC1155471.1 YolD-like family protein [Cytobacillus horneckiae]MED2940613.1 YolD-like family protein [Cytobacillus horneckiae]
MIRDRGNKKWVSMMLPEHVKMLREYDESHRKLAKPILDEQKYEQFDEMIAQAMEYHLPLRFTLLQKGERNEVIGHVHYVDGLKEELRVIDEALKPVSLKLADIINIEEKE